MSQHRFTYGELHVLTGWDRPLQHFFLVVEKENADDEYVYTNLNDPDLPWGGMTIGQVTAKLAELSIPLPLTLVEELMSDQKCNVGNRLVNHGKVDI